MRFDNALLLFSSVSALFLPSVVSLPIRIVVVEKVSFEDAEAFLRSVRIGHAGANALTDSLETNADLPSEPNRLPPWIHLPGSAPDSIPSSGGIPHAPSVAIPMTPDAEFNILPFFDKDIVEKHNQALKEMCERENRSWRVRFGRMSDWVRELLGLPPVLNDIRPTCDPDSFDWPRPAVQSTPTPLPVVNDVTPPRTVIGKPCHIPGSGPMVNAWGAGPITGARNRRPSLWASRRPKSFAGRLQKALYSLSPWEGRCLAFVLGCGLGVLLRMVYVFVILGVRAWRWRNQKNAVELPEDEDESLDRPIVEAVILFDAASIKSASQEALVYNEKE